MLGISTLTFLTQLFLYAGANSVDTSRDIVWSACGDPSRPRECGTFEAPLDYHDASVGKAQLAVIRVNATKTPRLGTLFVNPGGPGNGGVSWLLGDDLDLLIEGSGGQYDIVSWDPRGTGGTKPRVKCFDSTSDARTFWNGSTRGAALEVRDGFSNSTARSEFYSHVQEVDEALIRFYDRCDSKSMHMLQYMGTAATARDMVSLHDYLEGTNEINYWGFSYGTLLGNYFVNMFPDRVGRVILDGVLNPWVWSTKPPLDTLEIILTDTQKVFDGFASACADAGPSRCAIAQNGSTSESISNWTLELLRLAYDHTRATGGTVITSGVLRAQIWAGMYRPSGWKALAQFLRDTSEALHNSTIPAATSKLTERAAAARHAPIPTLIHRRADSNDTDQSNPDLDFSPQAIACSDSSNSSNGTSQQVFDFEVNATDERTKLLGSVTWLMPDTFCHRWPARAVERYAGPFNRTLANPIIVIGNYYDPVTPLASAELVAGAFGKSAVLLKRNAYGHTSLGMRSTCTNDLISKYLNSNRLPQDGMECETDQTLF
ncbi:hypothetical protein FRC09_005503 [Ceratobasidium sp. 395]|nr:hypothetical protein FRC09_005503 [Ceratobasidium sp. 395]